MIVRKLVVLFYSIALAGILTANAGNNSFNLDKDKYNLAFENILTAKPIADTSAGYSYKQGSGRRVSGPITGSDTSFMAIGVSSKPNDTVVRGTFTSSTPNEKEETINSKPATIYKHRIDYATCRWNAKTEFRQLTHVWTYVTAKGPGIAVCNIISPSATKPFKANKAIKGESVPGYVIPSVVSNFWDTKSMTCIKVN